MYTKAYLHESWWICSQLANISSEQPAAGGAGRGGGSQNSLFRMSVLWCPYRANREYFDQTGICLLKVDHQNPVIKSKNGHNRARPMPVAVFCCIASSAEVRTKCTSCATLCAFTSRLSGHHVCVFPRGCLVPSGALPSPDICRFNPQPSSSTRFLIVPRVQVLFGEHPEWHLY